MAVTDLASVSSQIQKFWSPLFMKELREQLLLGALVNKEYDGQIKAQGDTVYVSQINAPTGQLLTVGTNADSFQSEEVSMTRVSIQANKRAVAAFEIQDLANLQSQLEAQDSELRTSLLFAINKQINNYLYTLVSPSTSAPDHLLSGITDMNASQVNATRRLASAAKWGREKGWYMLVDPSYMSDILNAATLTSSDYGASDAPIIGGQVALKRFGFNILEDNSDGILQLSPAGAGADCALAFHPDFMHMVMQTQPTFQLSSLHSQKKFGYVLSVDIVFGAGLGVAGNKKHIQTYAT
ncbi:MAG: hypothetical protein E6R04_09620 [Spirochaetes bacterium]|nr:MAG: hypothetical protein E6R04_09620 [Spirochaetota bacterium]